MHSGVALGGGEPSSLSYPPICVGVQVVRHWVAKAEIGLNGPDGTLAPMRSCKRSVCCCCVLQEPIEFFDEDEEKAIVQLSGFSGKQGNLQYVLFEFRTVGIKSM